MKTLQEQQQQQRQKAIHELEQHFLQSLRDAGIELASNAVCRISHNSIELGITAMGQRAKLGFTMAFASEIELYCQNGTDSPTITLCSSGSFTPVDQECYWRTIHAASILKNWDIVTPILNEHCKMYVDLIFTNVKYSREHKIFNK